jgi:hypothetical protein
VKRKIILFLFLLGAVLSAATYGLLNYSYSDGIRSGKLVKLAKKGAILKTYEGTLDLGSGDQLTWDFSIHDSELGEALVKKTGQQVKLEYRELLYKVFYSTKYDVVSWSMLRVAGNENFCRLVNVIRNSKFIVDKVKDLIEKHDASLIEDARRCQN